MVSHLLFLHYLDVLSVFHLDLDKLEVFIRDDGERGVRAVAPFRSGQFVCEFEANLLNEEEFKEAETEHKKEGRTVYTLEVSIGHCEALVIDVTSPSHSGPRLLLRHDNAAKCLWEVHEPCGKGGEYQAVCPY